MFGAPLQIETLIWCLHACLQTHHILPRASRGDAPLPIPKLNPTATGGTQTKNAVSRLTSFKGGIHVLGGVPTSIYALACIIRAAVGCSPNKLITENQIGRHKTLMTKGESPYDCPASSEGQDLGLLKEFFLNPDIVIATYLSLQEMNRVLGRVNIHYVWHVVCGLLPVLVPVRFHSGFQCWWPGAPCNFLSFQER